MMRVLICVFVLFFSVNVYSQKTAIIVADTTDSRASCRVLKNMFGEYSNDTWTVVLKSSYLDHTKHPEDAIISLCKFEKEMVISSKKINKYEIINSRNIARNKDGKKLKELLNRKGLTYYLIFKEDLNDKKIKAHEIYINIDYLDD
jgi:hypothetical protein